MQANLSFDQAPPISVPFRFFLAAPLFGVAAGVLLCVLGEEVLSSRWAPGTLAFVHLMVAGFMLQVMCGALLQFVPVAAGGNVWRPQRLATITQPLLAAAAVLLATAFLTQRAALFAAAAHAFAAGLGLFLFMVGWAVWRTPAVGATILSLRIAVAGLLATLVLGMLLALGLAHGTDLPFLALVDIHAAWGLWGWALMLFAGVAYFVVPMFQLTPAYPAWFANRFPVGLLVLLILWTSQLFGDFPVVRDGLFLAGLIGGGGFAAMTLHLQNQRRRKVSDTTYLLFRLAMGCLLTLPVLAAVPVMIPLGELEAPWTLMLGILLIMGVFTSAITGMIYKIMPFLGWLHLQRACGLRAIPPTMNRLLDETWTRRQLYCHGLALILLLASVWWPTLARPAGATLAFSCAMLGFNMLGTVRAYSRFKAQIPADG